MADPHWPFPPPRVPMEATVRDDLPPAPGWAYEPKWDGFRMLAWSGTRPRLDSRNGKDLLRYFPELVPALGTLPEGTVVDGEVVAVSGGRTDFDLLQSRIHPAESRIRRLAEETPARLVAFDLLAVGGEDLRQAPFAVRRERLASVVTGLEPPWNLTPSTEDEPIARRWFDEFEAAGCDGIVAKRLSKAYIEGRREMVKIKHRRTVDCVVAGYRLHKEGDRVGSILLGLYDARAALHFIGHTSGFSADEARDLLEALRSREGTDAFGEDARRPGVQSRWSGGKDLSWIPVRPELVVEISYDQLTGDRFRHATRVERWRPDKEPAQCTMDQLERPTGTTFDQVVGDGGH